jgi:hypothetical protein
MTTQGTLGISVMVVGLLLPTACDQTLRTGRVGNTTNAPAPDGTCNAGQSVCGSGAFAQCLDLQNDREHCGTCDNACLSGIACAAGACQQVACTGSVTVSTQSISGTTTPADANDFADINGDGRQDLVSWGDRSNNATSTFQVALGEAGGGFAAATTYQSSGYPEDIVAGDSNGDGFQDLYVSILGPSTPSVELWLGHADGKLTLARATKITGCSGETVADLNGDGKLDLVAGLTDTSGPTVFLADANGDFHLGTSYPKCTGAQTVVQDWNGDGFPDLVNLWEILSVCLNKGDGTFEDGMDCGVATSTSGASDQTVVIGDFNRDGHPDLAAARDSSVVVLLGMGGCQFQPTTEYPLTDVVSALASGDVNGDGILDVVASTKDGALSLLLGGPDETFQIISLSASGTSGGIGSLMVGDVTGDGKADIVFVPTVENILDSTGALVQVGGGESQILENTCP